MALCNMKFVRNGGLKEHLRDFHKIDDIKKIEKIFEKSTTEEETVYDESMPSCDICKKSYSKMENLLIHMQKIHLSNKINGSHPRGKSRAARVTTTIEKSFENVNNSIRLRRKRKETVIDTEETSSRTETNEISNNNTAADTASTSSKQTICTRTSLIDTINY